MSRVLEVTTPRLWSDGNWSGWVTSGDTTDYTREGICTNSNEKTGLTAWKSESI